MSWQTTSTDKFIAWLGAQPTGPQHLEVPTKAANHCKITNNNTYDGMNSNNNNESFQGSRRTGHDRIWNESRPSNIIWESYNNSQTWKVRPFRDDSYINHDSSEGEQWGRYNLPRYYSLFLSRKRMPNPIHQGALEDRQPQSSTSHYFNLTGLWPSPLGEAPCWKNDKRYHVVPPNSKLV